MVASPSGRETDTRLALPPANVGRTNGRHEGPQTPKPEDHRLSLADASGHDRDWDGKGCTVDRPRPMSQRPVWDWGVHLSRPLLSLDGVLRVLPVIAADAVPNAVRHPLTLWRAGRLARQARLAGELEDLKRRRMPVVILWGSGDTVLPRACAQSLIDALHAPHVVTVPGDHSWLIRQPRRFVEEVTNVIGPGETAA